MENERLTNEFKTSREANLKLKSEGNTNKTISQEALKAANVKLQYSRQKNIKFFNLQTTPKKKRSSGGPGDPSEKDHNMKLNPSEISAIHRIP